MKEPIKSILKLIFVGMATTVVRIIGPVSYTHLDVYKRQLS